MIKAEHTGKAPRQTKWEIRTTMELRRRRRQFGIILWLRCNGLCRLSGVQCSCISVATSIYTSNIFYIAMHAQPPCLSSFFPLLCKHLFPETVMLISRSVSCYESFAAQYDLNAETIRTVPSGLHIPLDLLQWFTHIPVALN